MKFTTEKATLRAALENVARVVKGRTTIPILSNFKVEVGDVLTITATDMDVEASAIAAVDVAKKGTITIPAADFSAIVKAMPEGSSICVEMDGPTVKVIAGRSRYKLPTMPADDFPNFGTSNFTASFELDAKHLSAAIDAVAPFMSSEQTRYYLCGVLVQNSAEGIRLVSTDGHRLALACVSGVFPEFPDVIVPRETIALWKASLGEGAVSISIGPARIGFKVGSLSVESKVIDATYPDYQRIIPDGGSVMIEADSRTLKATTARVALIGDKATSAVKITLGKSSCVLTATGANGGEAEDEVEMLSNSGEIEIGFNSRYLADICAACGDGPITIRMKDNASPALITPSGDDAATFVLMPMRV